MATKHQKFSLNLQGYDDVEREAIAIEVIDKIIKRTRQGKDKNGDKLDGKYSKGYEQSQAFKIGGKSKGKIDLTLSGDMLDSIEILKNSKKVEIGFQKGSVENGKADGNIRGTYGQDKPIPGKARDFLGISDSELQSILRKYPKDSDKAQQRAKELLIKNKESDRLSGKVDVADLEEEDG